VKSKNIKQRSINALKNKSRKHESQLEYSQPEYTGVGYMEMSRVHAQHRPRQKLPYNTYPMGTGCRSPLSMSITSCRVTRSTPALANESALVLSSL
jgi:hypothetical protein